MPSPLSAETAPWEECLGANFKNDCTTTHKCAHTHIPLCLSLSLSLSLCINMHTAYTSKMPEIKLKLKFPNQLFEGKLLGLYNNEIQNCCHAWKK